MQNRRPCSPLGSHAVVLLALALSVLGGVATHGQAVTEIEEGTAWGETSRGLLEHFGGRAMLLPQPLDFGDSYAQLVLRDVLVGGIPLIAFFQMDKATGGLKRIQLERQRHGVNPPAFRGVLAGLEAAYGRPDALCGVRPGPVEGYQAAAERVWHRGRAVIRAIFRDTTIEAFEGCLAGDPSAGPCGLTGRLLVRISPPESDAGTCPASRGVR